MSEKKHGFGNKSKKNSNKSSGKSSSKFKSKSSSKYKGKSGGKYSSKDSRKSGSESKSKYSRRSGGSKGNKFNKSKNAAVEYPIIVIDVSDSDRVVEGNLSVVKDKFAFIDTETESVFVHSRDFNGALDGDKVRVRITAENESKKSEGEVVAILERTTDRVVGIVERSKNFAFVRPTHSFGRDIFIHRNSIGGARDGELVVVKVTDFGGEGRKPEGVVLEILGDPYDTDVMIEALVKRSNIGKIFPNDVRKAVEKIPTFITKAEIKSRVDLRRLPIITIDGADAKDLDDAVYLEKVSSTPGSEIYKLIVSIADVSHYVAEGGLIDAEALRRGNSTYLVDRVLPMIPEKISNGTCSLNPNTDKLTLTCDMMIDSDGNVLTSDIYKSVINTAHRMTYTDVNKILAYMEADNSDVSDEQKAEQEQGKLLYDRYKNVTKMLKDMHELSLKIRKKKHERGYIDFDLPEVKVKLNEYKKVEKLELRDRGEAERIIEDFMIEANEAVAEKLQELKLPALYRIHEKPDTERLETMNETLAKFKYNIPSLEGVSPKKFQSILEETKDSDISMIINKVVLRSLKQARYSKENLGHFGLASEYYTHFTSPIRRYSDLIVHRVLSAYIDNSEKGRPIRSKTIDRWNNIFDEVATQISKTERNSMKLEEESIKIKVVEYMKDKVGDVMPGRIVGFSDKKIFIETNELVECVFDVTKAPHFYEFNNKDYTMVNKDKGEIYNLGDTLEILIARADLSELVVEVVPHASREEA